MKKIVDKLLMLNKTISTMESCTGGGVANAITNIEGASRVLKFSAVTYSNEYKVKMGVSADTIEKYSVYSSEVAREMSKKISDFTNSDYGIGITGKLNRYDPNNLFGDDNTVFISIYDKNTDVYIEKRLTVDKNDRETNKNLVIQTIFSELINILSCVNTNNNEVDKIKRLGTYN